MVTFSVITPAYNAEAFIGRAIESVRSQTYSDWEMIIINNGSTDNTRNVVEKFILKDPRIKLINCEKNSGSPARPRNLGLKEAGGGYIVFLDADDTFFPEKLSEVKTFFLDNPDAELVCHGEAHMQNGRVIRREFYGPYASYQDLLFRGNSLSTSAIAMKRDCVEKAGFFSESSELKGFEDYDYWLRVAKVCRIRYLRKILGTYSVNVNSEAAQIAMNCKNALDFLEQEYAQWERKSLYFSWLMRERRASWLRVSGRECMRMRNFKRAIPFLGNAIRHNPFELKQWIFLFVSISGSILKR